MTKNASTEAQRRFIESLARGLDDTTVRDLLAPGGTAALVGGDGHPFFGPFGRILRSAVTRGRFRPITAVTRTETTAQLVERAASARLTPHLERTFPLSQAGAALAYVEAGRTVGKVVVVRDGLLDV